MNYAESVAYIDSLAPTILNPSLLRFALFMDEQGRIQDQLRTIHIGGTNGKGSTVAMVDSVLRAAGLKVGRFTGPHLLRWNERFHFNGKPIDDNTFAQYATRLRELSEAFGAKHPEHGHLTWFEFLTAIAFFYFHENDVDVAVFEVGLGGRWDATNVLTKPLVSCITTIDLDHTHILGGTVAEIAGEKAGIIKESVPLVTGTSGDALRVIETRALENGAPLFQCTAPSTVHGPLPINTDVFSKLRAELALLGEFQQQNALQAFVILSICEPLLDRPLLKYLKNGFESVYWPGRFQYLPERHTLLDGAHNAAGAVALRRALDQQFPANRRLFVLSFFQNKNVSASLKSLIRPGDKVYAATANSPRAVFKSDDIVEVCRQIGAAAQNCESIAAAFQQAESARSGDDLIIVAGSFATIKETMLSFGWASVEDGKPCPLDPACRSISR